MTLSFALAPLSERALAFRGGEGGSNVLALPTDRPFKIGRHPDSDVRLPPDWIQISTKHCELRYNAPLDCFVVKDTSTNGTFVNGVKVGKNREALAKAGDKVQLSVADSKSPQNHMEYELQRVGQPPHAACDEAEGPSAALAGAPDAATPTPKRKQPPGAGAGGPLSTDALVTASKRSRTTTAAVAAGSPAGGQHTANGSGAPELGPLFHLKQNNEQLMRDLDQERAGRAALEKELRLAREAGKQAQQAAAEQAAKEVKAAQAAQRSAESALAQARSREVSLRMELEGAHSAVENKEGEAAAAAAATAEEHARREAAEARATSLESQLYAARGATEGAAAAAATELAGMRREAEAARAAREEAERRAGELAAALEAAQAALDQNGGQLKQQDQLERLLAEERGARQAAEGQLREAQEATEEALQRIASLESRERRLQNDRLVIDGCLVALQRNNARSAAANSRITSAFAELQEAKAEADTIMAEQAQQCREICEQLATGGGASEPEQQAQQAALRPPSAAGHTPQGFVLVETQAALLPGYGLYSPLGTVPMTAPPAAAAAAGAGLAGLVAAHLAAGQQQVQLQEGQDGAAAAADDEAMEDAGAEGAPEPGQDQQLGSGQRAQQAGPGDEEAQQPQQEEFQEGWDVDMGEAAEAEERSTAPEPSATPIAAAVAQAAVAAAVAAQATPLEGQQGAGSGVASTPVHEQLAGTEGGPEAEAGAGHGDTDEEVVVVSDSEDGEEAAAAAEAQAAQVRAQLAMKGTQALEEEEVYEEAGAGTPPAVEEAEEEQGQLADGGAAAAEQAGTPEAETPPAEAVLDDRGASAEAQVEAVAPGSVEEAAAAGLDAAQLAALAEAETDDGEDEGLAAAGGAAWGGAEGGAVDAGAPGGWQLGGWPQAQQAQHEPLEADEEEERDAQEGGQQRLAAEPSGPEEAGVAGAAGEQQQAEDYLEVVDHENMASQGNTADTQDDGSLRSLSKGGGLVPESEPHESRTTPGSAHGPDWM